MRFNLTGSFCRLFSLCLIAGLALVIFSTAGFGQSKWAVKPSNTSASLNAVVFGGGLFVGVGDNGTIVTSPDGEVWTPRVSGTNDRLPAIAYGKGRFVATRENRVAPALSSPDGITWTPITVTDANGAPAESTAWKGIAFGQGQFLTVGAPSALYYSYADILRSDDGVTFKVIEHAKYPQIDALTDRVVGLSFFRDRFYGLLEGGGFLGTPDGVTWKGSIGNGAVMASDGSTKVATISTFSVDAGHTIGRANYPLTKINGACYGAGRYVAGDYQGRIWTSETDGEYWRPRERYAQNGEEFRAVAFNGVDRFVAVGSAAPGGSALIAVATADPLPSFPGSYTIFSLKELTNGLFTTAPRAISNSGIIAGTVKNSNGTVGAIFRDGITTTYPDPIYGTAQTAVTSVNDNGFAALELGGGSGSTIGVALPQNVRTFPGVGVSSTAPSINSGGSIVGTYLTSTQRGIYRFNASTGELVDLGNFGLQYIEATSISDSGDIAGRYYAGYDPVNYLSRYSPFLVAANGQVTLIATLGGSRQVENIVVNSLGHVAGSTDLSSQGTAFMFKDGATTDIDVLKSQGSAVRGMNNKDEVVGYFQAANPKSFQSVVGNAFLYHDDAMYDLNKLLDESGDGWVLREATAINDNGWIVGEGYRHSFYTEPFLAIPNAGKPAEPPTRFVNLSTRLRAGTGDDALIAGFVLRGGAKKLVIRAIGPGLVNNYDPSLSVPNPLADPTLTLFNDRGEQIAFNDNFTDYPVFPIQNEIGGYGLAPPYAWPVIRDSVIMITLPEGSYTAVVRGKDGSSGNCLVEVYNVDTDYTPGLLNISTRGPVGTGDDVMIAGFIVRGDRERRILVRAIGPSLAASGVPNPLADPMLEIHDQNGQIAANDDWRSDQKTEIANAGFAPGDNRDAAVILSLWPGNYTAIVRGKGGATGNALVEVYALP